MNIESWGIDRIKPYHQNPRINDGAVEKTAISINEYGWQQPIVVDSDGFIVVGHTRLKAAKKLGLKEAPVLVAENLTPAQIKAYRIADNKTGELADWDMDLLNAEIQELADMDFDIELTGFDADDFDFLDGPGDGGGLTDDDAVPEVPEDPVCKLGELWLLGDHRVLCGDSTDRVQVERLLSGESIDMIFTDPPYGIGEKGDRRKRNGKNSLKKGVQYKDFVDDSIQYAVDAYNLCEGLKIPRHVWWGANYYCHALPQSNNWFIWDKRVEEKQKNLNSDCEMAWVKSEFSSIRIFRHLWKGLIKGSENGQARVHPTQKPIALAEWCFDYFKSVESVLDLFLGSGSTLIACQKTNRKCFGAELDPTYVQVILQRWADFTGEDPVRDDGVRFSEVKK